MHTIQLSCGEKRSINNKERGNTETLGTAEVRHRLACSSGKDYKLLLERLLEIKLLKREMGAKQKASQARTKH